MKPGGVLALDLATITGWAYARPPPTVMAPPGDMFDDTPIEKPDSGWRRLGAPGASDGAFFRDFETWLIGMLEQFEPRVVVFESPILWAGKTSVYVARRLMTLAGLTHLVCHRAEVRVDEMRIQTVKKAFAGNGHAKKPAMIAACHARGWEVDDDNESDALALWWTWCRDWAAKRSRRSDLCAEKAA